MSGIRIHLFGPPRFTSGEIPIPFGRTKALALLAFLTRETNTVSRDKAVDLLWPTFSPSDARNNLRRELSILKDHLPAGTLIADRLTISLDTTAVSDGRIWIDTREFEAKANLHHGHTHPANDYCQECIEVYEAAADLYTDDFLAGFSLPDSAAFDEWQFQQSEALRGALNHILEVLVGWYEQQEIFDRALIHGHRWVSLDPFHEEANRALMRLYAAGEQQAAAIRQYEKFVLLLRDELQAEPDSETKKLYEQIRQHRGKASQRNNYPMREASSALPFFKLPADTTPFIGREKEVTQLVELLSSDQIRMVTVTGVGGMGKTRLALAAARRMTGLGDKQRFADGIFFIPLAPVSDPALISQTLAMGLGLTPGSEGNAAQQLIAHLKPLHALIVVDNLEHLLDTETVSLLGKILPAAPGVKILATSRTRLGLSGEYVLPIDGLEVNHASSIQPGSSPVDIAVPGDAIKLFEETARRTSNDFSVDECNIESIRRICELVGGMPLGIELAAAWIELLTPEAIAEEIQCSMDFLSSVDTDAPGRQSSLKAVFDSSWKLLGQEERTILTQLSIFPGTFEREAAGNIARASLRTLLSLRNKSWLQPVGENRYQIHPLLRQYLAQELANGKAAEKEACDRHAEFFVAMLVSLNEQMRGPGASQAFDHINDELDNLMAATLWLVGSNRLNTIVDEMAVPLLRYLESKYRYFLFQPIIFEAARRAEVAGETRIHGILLAFQSAFFFNGYPTRIIDYIWVGPVWQVSVRTAWQHVTFNPQHVSFWDTVVAWHYGRFVDATAGEKRLREIIKQLKTENRRWEEAFARQSLGRLLARHGAADGEEAAKILHEALAIFETLGDERESAITLSFLGFQQQASNNLQQAERTLLAAQARLRSTGEYIIAASLNWQLADIYMSEGKPSLSLANFHEMADILIHSGLKQLAISTLSRESYESVRYGDLNNALRLRQQAMSLSIQTGDEFTEAWDCWEMAEIYRVMGQVDEARNWNERARQKFAAIRVPDVRSFYHRLLGDLALAEEDIIGAADHFRQTIQFAEEANHPWQRAYGLIGLGSTATLAGQFIEAATHLSEGILMALDSGDQGGLVMVGLSRAARLFRKNGQPETAETLARIIINFPMSWGETRREAAAILAMDDSSIPPRNETMPVPLRPLIEPILANLHRIK